MLRLTKLRVMTLLLVLPFIFGASVTFAQAKKPVAATSKAPGPKDNSISVVVYLRDAGKNEVLLGTRIWPDYPDYNAAALQRLFATMKALEPAYKQDDEVAYSWGTKGKVTKCSIYLESSDAGNKTGTGATVGCEANAVSSVGVVSTADPKHPPSSSLDPRHVSDVVELFKKQSDRAKATLPK